MKRRTVLSTTCAASVALLAGCVGGESDGPEEVTRQYFEARRAGDREAANEAVLSSDVPIHVEEDIERIEGSAEITSVEDVGVAGFVETAREEGNEPSLDVDSLEAELDAELGYDEHTYVSLRYEAEETEVDTWYLVGESDGEWGVLHGPLVLG